MNKFIRTIELKKAINPIKSDLIDILRELERDGLASAAKSLSKIVAKLEDFQSR